jgi:SSS family solute:Na+ symporter/sodium/proline symporter
VLAVALAAIALAYSPDNTILGLVGNAWAGFGAAFGPLVILCLTWRRLTLPGALAGVIVGAATVILWILPILPDGAKLDDTIYAMVPGFVLSFLATMLVSLATPPLPRRRRAVRGGRGGLGGGSVKGHTRVTLGSH